MYRRRFSGRKKNVSATTATISKSAASLLEEYGLQEHIKDILGTGAQGNIIKKDVIAWIEKNGSIASDEEE